MTPMAGIAVGAAVQTPPKRFPEKTNSNKERKRMEQVWLTAALWLILALVATLLSIWFRISTALSEIVVGTVAQLFIDCARELAKLTEVRPRARKS